jgi:hypothetical protein
MQSLGMTHLVNASWLLVLLVLANPASPASPLPVLHAPALPATHYPNPATPPANPLPRPLPLPLPLPFPSELASRAVSSPCRCVLSLPRFVFPHPPSSVCPLAACSFLAQPRLPPALVVPRSPAAGSRFPTTLAPTRYHGEPALNQPSTQPNPRSTSSCLLVLSVPHGCFVALLLCCSAALPHRCKPAAHNGLSP